MNKNYTDDEIEHLEVNARKYIKELHFNNRIIKIMSFVTIVIVLGVALGMAGCPRYNVWSQGMKGEAELNRSIQTKKIMIEQALAEKESAKFRAEAIKIIGEATKKYPEYRQQEFMGAFGEALKEGTISQIIYVPTEAGIPILEAGRVGTK